MGKNTLVIGGTRFFGLRLVARLLEGGDRVTLATRGHAPHPFGDRVRHVRVDRRDAAAMHAAFADADFDLVHDQVCYTPADARIAAAVFAGRVRRYVMASTIEVYAHLAGGSARPFRESDVVAEPGAAPDDPRWADAAWAAARYGQGKREAEALLAAAAFPVAAVRIGHVLAGPEDFTGRLAQHVRAARAGAGRGEGRSSFVDPDTVADFLHWTGRQSFTGAVNAACAGPLSAAELQQRILGVIGEPPRGDEGAGTLPFDYPHPYEMDLARAASLGYRFGRSDVWLPGLIRQHLESESAT
jgi:nucleoside-diphosphate-sugar epimerase